MGGEKEGGGRRKTNTIGHAAQVLIEFNVTVCSGAPGKERRGGRE